MILALRYSGIPVLQDREDVKIPIILFYAAGKLSAFATLLAALAAALVVPLLLYRLSWGWWLMVYYFFLPENVPGNLEGRAEDDE